MRQNTRAIVMRLIWMGFIRYIRGMFQDNDITGSMRMQQLNIQNCLWLIQAALVEDIGAGDVTGEALIPAEQQARLVMRAREPLVVCGLTVAAQVFATLQEDIRCRAYVNEGAYVQEGDVLLEIEGDAQIILAAERTALNFMARMSAVATNTRRYVDAVAGTGVEILDTRKTLPGYRTLDKYAVRVGGGRNHRMRLDDGMLIKDNHIALCGGVAQAIAKARAAAPHLMKILVECDTIEQVEQAIEAGAEMLLLDNMDIETLTLATAIAKKHRVLTEASGNMTLERVRDVAHTGVDFISVGRLTHSAPNVDIGLDVELLV
jgi:nicotinate-nucleotide pyrophosphorylase (carboxylating)